MKREEKNQQTRRRIMDRALEEFSAHGYGASSINAICSGQDISKGIVYHYFESKDALFLACVEECFQRLTSYMQEHLTPEYSGVEAQLDGYFQTRLAFFEENPVYRRIFREAVVTPPAHLTAGIVERMRAFDAMNIQILERILTHVKLRPSVTQADVIVIFRLFQDFVNTQEQPAGAEFEAREKLCRKAMDILLYGVVESAGAEHACGSASGPVCSGDAAPQRPPQGL